MQINLTTIIIALVVAAGLYLIPSPFQHSEQLPAIHDTVTVTKYIPQPTEHGSTAGIVKAKRDTVYIATLPEMHVYYEKVIDTTFAGNHLYIRSRTYPYLDNDTLNYYISLEWNLTPRPIEVDSIKIPVPVYVKVPESVPFYKKPSVVVPVTAVATITILKLLGLLK
jgi:hypothetical protein